MITHLGVCGLGKLGLPIAASFGAAGLRVIGYDLNEKIVEQVNARLVPSLEPGLSELIQDAPNLTATRSAAGLASATEACIFVTPTPSLPDGNFDNRYLVAGIDRIAQAVGERNYVFIVASTVTPESCQKILLPTLRKHCRHGELIYKPELIALGSVVEDLKHPDVSVYGGENLESVKKVLALYDTIQKNTVSYLMSFIEAELAKISLNCAITMKISFANQVGLLADRLGANAHAILDFVGRDRRIGRCCLKPGMPYGGPCFPRDNRMFQYVARRAGMVAPLASATDFMNEAVLEEIVSRVPAEGAIGILGLTYKAGTPITEEAAGMKLRMIFEERGRNVLAYDPLVPDSHHLLEVIACPIVIITTDCQQFQGLEFPETTRVIDPLGVTRKARLSNFIEAVRA